MSVSGALVRCVPLIVAAACAGSPGVTGVSPASTGPSAAPTGDLDMSVYPPCAEQPPPPSLPDVEGLTLPSEATVFSVYEVGPLTQAEGIVALSPVQMRSYYEEHAALDVLSVEDERVEAEILVTDGTHRMFVKVQVVCSTGSNFTATIGSEADSAAVPAPAGTRARPR